MEEKFIVCKVMQGFSLMPFSFKSMAVFLEMPGVVI